MIFDSGKRKVNSIGWNVLGISNGLLDKEPINEVLLNPQPTTSITWKRFVLVKNLGISL